jgi:hypothetical protein
MDTETRSQLITIGGMILAFVVSFFAEPIKIHFANEHEKKLLTKAIYVEMAFMYARMASLSLADASSYTIDTFKKGLLIVARFEVYEYAKSKPLVFAQLKEAPGINAIYASLRIFCEGFLISTVQQYTAHAGQILNAIEARLAVGDIDRKLFLESLNKEDAEAVKIKLSRYTPEMIHKILG